jgi:hypothetical protein
VKIETTVDQPVLNEIIITDSSYTTKHEFLEAIELVRASTSTKLVVTQTTGSKLDSPLRTLQNCDPLVNLRKDLAWLRVFMYYLLE